MVTQYGGKATSLGEVVAQLDKIDEDLTIYASQAVGVTEDVSVILIDEDSQDPPESMAYLLEISLAKDVLQVWSSWREGRVPTIVEACRAIEYYSTHDSYEPI